MILFFWKLSSLSAHHMSKKAGFLPALLAVSYGSPVQAPFCSQLVNAVVFPGTGMGFFPYRSSILRYHQNYEALNAVHIW